MKVICLGGDLIGLDPVVAKVADLEEYAAADERLVLVCHGLPTEKVKDKETGKDYNGFSPALLDFNLHAVVLAHRDHAPAPEHLGELREHVGTKCPRTFAMTRGWDTLDPDTRRKLIEFLKSDEADPAEEGVRVLLGGDSPVAKLALRVALEIAQEELGGMKGRGGGRAAPGLKALFAPAFDVARREAALADAVGGIATALASGGKERLREEVARALNALDVEYT
jgi:hypothetical protein